MLTKGVTRNLFFVRHKDLPMWTQGCIKFHNKNIMKKALALRNKPSHIFFYNEEQPLIDGATNQQSNNIQKTDLESQDSSTGRYMSSKF